jgi:hypothetical protein
METEELITFVNEYSDLLDEKDSKCRLKFGEFDRIKIIDDKTKMLNELISCIYYRNKTKMFISEVSKLANEYPDKIKVEVGESVLPAVLKYLEKQLKN